MKKYLIILILLVFCLNFVFANDSGSIWTTRQDCGSDEKNVNLYARGEKVYISGNNFEKKEYEWFIKGLNGGASCDPNEIVAQGIFKVDESNKFCFDAYTVNLDDCGEYKVDFNGKHDNYRVHLDAPIVPEFGFVIGVLTMISALGVFFFIRR